MLLPERGRDFFRLRLAIDGPQSQVSGHAVEDLALPIRLSDKIIGSSGQNSLRSEIYADAVTAAIFTWRPPFRVRILL